MVENFLMIWQEDFLPRWTEFAIQYFFPFFPSFKDECGQTPPSTGELSKLAETLQTDFQEKGEKLFIFFVILSTITPHL